MVAPAKTYSIPFNPSGFNAWLGWCREHNVKCNESPRWAYYLSFSQRGDDRRFRDWLFANYAAEIVGSKRTMTFRFLDEHQMLLFMIKWA